MIYVCFAPESGRREGGRCMSANDPERTSGALVKTHLIDDEGALPPLIDPHPNVSPDGILVKA